jgi:hypothetical protein
MRIRESEGILNHGLDVRHRQPVKTLAKEDIIGIRYQATASEDEM